MGNKNRFLKVMTAMGVAVTIMFVMPITAQTQTWYCGAYDNPGGVSSVTATLVDGTLTISGIGNMSNNYFIDNIPWIDQRTSITKIVIGNSVTSIGGYAFYNCSGLTSVTIGNSVTSIGGYAFYNC
ncbi:MAG: leucine-rich repeat domain-containing protein, partial [Chitinispirillales bacterium]|nr:leucine-rich repeat domain-containing protein [Chitinispirillales bacterium]